MHYNKQHTVLIMSLKRICILEAVLKPSKTNDFTQDQTIILFSLHKHNNNCNSISVH